MINCVVVDDEPLARENLVDFAGEVDFLRLSGTFEHPLQLISHLDKNPVDLIFLDIQMPKMSGIDFLKVCKHPPMVIITTAYSNYAVEGFQLSVLDYLLKPITFDRFFSAVSKARDYQKFLVFSAGKTHTGPSTMEEYFFIRCGNKYEKFFYDDVLYIESLQNYVNIFTTRGKFITLINLKKLEQHFDHPGFIRVHKSYMVSIRKIEVIEGNEIIMQSYRIPISRSYREQVLEKLMTNTLWNKK